MKLWPAIDLTTKRKPNCMFFFGSSISVLFTDRDMKRCKDYQELNVHLLDSKSSNWVRTEFPSPGSFATVTTTSIARERISVTCCGSSSSSPKGKLNLEYLNL
jgi:hypothetical protein